MSIFNVLMADLQRGFGFMFAGNHADARSQVIAKAQVGINTLKTLAAAAEASGMFDPAARDAITKAEADLDATMAAFVAANGSDPNMLQNVMGAMSAVIAVLPAKDQLPAMVAQAALSVLLPTLLGAAA